jgi:hypothetical protein
MEFLENSAGRARHIEMLLATCRGLLVLRVGRRKRPPAKGKLVTENGKQKTENFFQGGA